jgi:glycosyltransferase involved in cell wall biosynthesis
MKQILIISSEYRKSGPTNVILNYVRKLSDFFDISLVSLRLETAKNSSIHDKFSAFGCNLKFFKKNILIKAVKELFKSHYAVINTHGIRADILVSIVGLFRPLSHYATIHNEPYKDYINRYGPLKGRIMFFMHNQFVFKNSNVVKLCVSKIVVNVLKSYGALNTKVSYNFIDNMGFKPAQSEASKLSLLASLNIPANKQVVVFCGHMTEIKDPLTLARAISRLDEDKYFFVFLGDGPLKVDVQNELKNQSNYIMPGFVSFPEKYYKCADVFVMTSLTEGMPMALLEAMSANLRIVASDIDIFNEICELDEFDMELFGVGDDALLSKAIEKAFSTQDICRNRDLSVKYFSGDDLFSQFNLQKYINE